ncbi:MAG: DEAD/DEAH box helicase [Sporomusaceae bacterium]|nr:DEAD/DEAH box helicase [Sporomusaceae bacterium]
MTINFTSLGIRPEAQDLLRQDGVSVPTAIQAQAIGPLLAGKDALIQAQTGTGKTLAYLLPLLEKLQPQKPHTQAVIIAPTRELALQISEVASRLAGLYGVEILSVCGGQDVDRQIVRLKTGIQLIVGTPGRILDHVRRRSIDLAGVTRLVIDEADQMLAMGFIEDVEAIIGQISAKRQLMLVSATLPGKIRELASHYMRKPVSLSVQTATVTLDKITQLVIETSEEGKIDVLCRLIDEYRPYLALVFCHTKQRAIMVGTALAQRGYAADELHGDLSQTKREQVMRRFSSAKLQILVATDIAARGLDIEAVTHVINFDIPHDPETYIHRIGRTGRAGESGVAATLVTPPESRYLRLIERGIQATLAKRGADGQLIVRKPARPRAKPSATTGKATAAKPAHAGSNNRSRRKPKPAAGGRPERKPARRK